MSSARATFASRWQQAVDAVPNDVFLVFEDSEGAVTTWTYLEFERLVSRVRAYLRSAEVGPGGRVHLVLRNSPAFVAVWLAAAGRRACIVPSDPQSSSRELALHVQRTRPRLSICGLQAEAACRTAAAEQAVPLMVVEENDCELRALQTEPAISVEPLRAEPRDEMAIMFTSGTTAAPKGVVVTQANYAFAGDVMAAAAALRRGDRHIVVLPLFHANAQYYSFASAISAGASVALMSSFSASRFLEQAARHGATHASLFAAPMRMILAQQPRPVDGSRLRHCWYAQNVSAEQYQQVTRLLGCSPRQLYGMTETIPAVLTNRALDAHADSMGVVTLGCTVELRSFDDGSATADGETGEVVIGGTPGITLFAGYLDDETTTAASFRDGWFRSGDLARRDSEGRFYFAGRRGDVLKVAGENVSVVEVEAVLASHPSVFEAAVIGEPDAIRDEVPVAFVVLAEGRPGISENELATWCAERLSKAKRPRRIEFVPELPRTSVGKIRKFQLRSPLVASR